MTRCTSRAPRANEIAIEGRREPPRFHAMKRRRIPAILLRPRPTRARRLRARAIRRLYQAFFGVMPGACEIPAANDPDKER